VINPPSGLPPLNRLPARHLVLIHVRVVRRRGVVPLDVQAGRPGRWQLAVVGDGDTEARGVEGAEVGAAEAAFVQDLLGGFVGREGGVSGEVEGACYWVAGW